jgi:hypothetical protein
MLITIYGIISPMFSFYETFLIFLNRLERKARGGMTGTPRRAPYGSVGRPGVWESPPLWGKAQQPS